MALFHALSDVLLEGDIPPQPPVSLPRSLQRKGKCNPVDRFCEFSTSFNVDFGDQNHLLQSTRKAKAVFEYLGTRWLNSCGSNDISYFDLTLENTENNGRRNLSGSSGSASGKCKGYNCPTEVEFSFPDRRLQLRSNRGLQECDGNGFKNDLLIYPDFNSENDEVTSGIVTLDTGDQVVTYNVLDQCDEIVCKSPQRTAVRSLFRELDLRAYIDEDKHECSWEGVHCDNNRSVSSIFLRRKGVRGKIATEIGLLTNLEHIDLAENVLKGKIPSEVGRLTRLNSLSLNDNELSGTLPREMVKLKNCKDNFTLGRNRMEGDMSFYCPKDETGHGCHGHGRKEGDNIFH